MYSFCLQCFVQHRQKLLVAYQTPCGEVVITGWCLGGKTLDNDVGTQAAQDLDKECDILLHAPEVEAFGVGIVLCRHGRGAKELKLMKLYGVDLQCIDTLGLVDEHPFALRGQAQDKVGASVQSALVAHGNGTLGGGKVVTAIDMFERLIVARLHAILYSHIFMLRQTGKVVELLLIHAVGTRADNDASNVGMRESLIVALTQTLQRAIGIGKGLEVCQKLTRLAVAAAVELHALVDLLGDALRALAIAWGERLVEAEGTAARREVSIAIGAGEARIDGDLLHTMTESTSEICRIAIEAATIAPRVYHF